MKRCRELEKAGSEILSAIDELSMVLVMDFPKVKPFLLAAAASATEPHNSTCSIIATKPFLSFFNLLLLVLDKIGPTMAVLRQDIYQNIQRLEKLYESDPSIYSNVLEILKKERLEGKAKLGRHTYSKAFVWLTRSLDFTVTLLQLLVDDFGRNLEEAVGEAYDLTLKPWHGWISSAAYKVAIKLVPDTKSFINLLMAKDKNQDVLKEELCALITTCIPLLEEIHAILKAYDLDKLKCI